jgi:hypothetical protein
VRVYPAEAVTRRIERSARSDERLDRVRRRRSVAPNYYGVALDGATP